MWLMTSHELIFVLYVKILFVFFPCESYPPTANSYPFSSIQVEHFTGRSGILCHTGRILDVAVFFISAVCDLRRALREQVLV